MEPKPLVMIDKWTIQYLDREWMILWNAWQRANEQYNSTEEKKNVNRSWNVFFNGRCQNRTYLVTWISTGLKQQAVSVQVSIGSNSGVDAKGTKAGFSLVVTTNQRETSSKQSALICQLASFYLGLCDYASPRRGPVITGRLPPPPPRLHKCGYRHVCHGERGAADEHLINSTTVPLPAEANIGTLHSFYCKLCIMGDASVDNAFIRLLLAALSKWALLLWVVPLKIIRTPSQL